MSNPTNKESLLSFPWRFPVKAMGRADTGFEAIFTQIVRKHAKLWPEEEIQVNPSKKGNYVGVTLVVVATSQKQLDAIYQDLTDAPEVLMAL